MNATATYECPACGQQVPEGAPHMDPRTEVEFDPTTGGTVAAACPGRMDPNCIIARNGLNPEHVCSGEYLTLREGESCWSVGNDTDPKLDWRENLGRGDSVTYNGTHAVVEFAEGDTIGMVNAGGSYTECERGDEGLVRR